MKNPFAAVGHWFEAIGKAIGGQLKIDTEAFLKSFVKDDLGKLAIDAVNIVDTQLVDRANIEKRDLAVSKFLEDAEAAGHDVTKFATSTAIWFVETALQAVRGKFAPTA